MDRIYEVSSQAENTLLGKGITHELSVLRHKRTMVPSDAYTNWNNRVIVILEELKKLHNMYTKESKKSLFSMYSRSRFTEKLKKAAIHVFALIVEESHLVDILVEKRTWMCIRDANSEYYNIPDSSMFVRTNNGLVIR